MLTWAIVYGLTHGLVVVSNDQALAACIIGDIVIAITFAVAWVRRNKHEYEYEDD